MWWVNGLTAKVRTDSIIRSAGLLPRHKGSSDGGEHPNSSRVYLNSKLVTSFRNPIPLAGRETDDGARDTTRGGANVYMYEPLPEPPLFSF